MTTTFSSKASFWTIPPGRCKSNFSWHSNEHRRRQTGSKEVYHTVASVAPPSRKRPQTRNQAYNTSRAISLITLIKPKMFYRKRSKSIIPSFSAMHQTYSSLKPIYESPMSSNQRVLSGHELKCALSSYYRREWNLYILDISSKAKRWYFESNPRRSNQIPEQNSRTEFQSFFQILKFSNPIPRTSRKQDKAESIHQQAINQTGKPCTPNRGRPGGRWPDPSASSLQPPWLP